MKHFLECFLPTLFIVCFLQVGCTKDQTETFDCLVEINGVFELTEITTPAEFIGGQDALFESIAKEISYPPEARENGIEGTVILQYEVTSIGTVENIVILEDIGEGCGEEARRTLEVITEGVSFHPAELNRVPVKVRKELPIKFILN